MVSERQLPHATFTTRPAGLFDRSHEDRVTIHHPDTGVTYTIIFTNRDESVCVTIWDHLNDRTLDQNIIPKE